MESYTGLAILTTNQRESLDAAFFRRLRFVVAFPFPDEALRRTVWERAFPQATPTEGLDFDRLARLNVAPGNIRSIAVNAAFLAAAQRDAVEMRHLHEAAVLECRKLERPVTSAELGGWL
jgi:ATP-dependent 26S proteasome regulatory subunit